MILAGAAAMLMASLQGTPASSMEKAGDGGGFTPEWRVGQYWDLKAIYPLPAGDGESTLVWRYRVTDKRGLEDEGGGEFYIIDIQERSGATSARTVLHIRCDDISLSKAFLHRKIRGMERERKLQYGREPVATGATITPYDLPLFPLVKGSKRTFGTRKAVGEWTVPGEVRQEVRGIDGDQVEEKGFPDFLKKKKGLYQVTCIDERGRVLFRQYWTGEDPWPAYGSGRGMTYWILGCEGHEKS